MEVRGLAATAWQRERAGVTCGGEVCVVVVVILVLVVRVFAAVLVYRLGVAAPTLHGPTMRTTTPRERAGATGRRRGHRAAGRGGSASLMRLGVRGACGEPERLSSFAGIPALELALHTLLKRKPEAAVSRPALVRLERKLLNYIRNRRDRPAVMWVW